MSFAAYFFGLVASLVACALVAMFLVWRDISHLNSLGWHKDEEPANDQG